jgi:LacI family transcriptional regulator
MTAIGVMRQAYDLSISVPRDLSVVGFDNIRLSEFVIPPLSTIQMSQAELARIAFKALMDELAQTGPSGGRREYPLNTSLILRRSTTFAPVDSVRGRVSRNRPTSATAKS